HTRFSRDWSSDVCSSDLQVMRAEQIDLGLADTAVQGFVFGLYGRRAEVARGSGQGIPGSLEQAAGRGRGSIAQGRQQFGARRGVIKVRKQAVDFAAGDVFVEPGGRHGNRRGRSVHRSVIRTSSDAEYRSITRQSPHIFRRSSAAPWNMAW